MRWREETFLQVHIIQVVEFSSVLSMLAFAFLYSANDLEVSDVRARPCLACGTFPIPRFFPIILKAYVLDNCDKNKKNSSFVFSKHCKTLSILGECSSKVCSCWFLWSEKLDDMKVCKRNGPSWPCMQGLHAACSYCFEQKNRANSDILLGKFWQNTKLP